MTLQLILGLSLGLALPACSFATYVRSQAAQDFPCPEAQVQTSETAHGIRARGCGKEAIYLRNLRSPLTRAAYELACPAEQLKMVDLDESSIGVEGCGRKATYTWVEGAWIQNARR